MAECVPVVEKLATFNKNAEVQPGMQNKISREEYQNQSTRHARGNISQGKDNTNKYIKL